MNINESTLLELDNKHIWHPCSQMKDYQIFKPLIIKSAKGSIIELSDGKKIIDAISSWWCKSLGHNHPRLMQALIKQAEQFEHVIFANTTHHTIIQLTEKLIQLCTPLNKVFYAGDGSCAVEIALKMSLHFRVIQGDQKRNQFIALKNGYHGETSGALSVSDLGIYKDPYQAMLFKTHFINEIPYVSGKEDPLWEDCSPYWPAIETSLKPLSETATALILEPLVQGAAGMKIYSLDFLRRLRQWCTQHHIHLIADEIMTGMGRTGKMLACEYGNIIPDFICLSKGLTSGWMPFSAVLTHDRIYDCFYDDYQSGKSFLHSHTFSGNALAASIALETFKIFEKEKILDHVNQIAKQMHQAMLEIQDITHQITNVRSLGAIVAADLIPHSTHERLGFEFYQRAVKNGALLRPIGNTIYWLPPLNTDFDTLENLKRITLKTLFELYK
jgi:adenosylmethionine-8-amino-7-oxononanoate aminotransferase